MMMTAVLLLLYVVSVFVTLSSKRENRAKFAFMMNHVLFLLISGEIILAKQESLFYIPILLFFVIPMYAVIYLHDVFRKREDMRNNMVR